MVIKTFEKRNNFKKKKNLFSFYKNPASIYTTRNYPLSQTGKVYNFLFILFFLKHWVCGRSKKNSDY